MFSTPGTRARQGSFASLLLRRLTRQNIAAPSDGVELFARYRAGRALLAQVDPAGLVTDVQPYIAGKKIGITTATGALLTGVTSLGWQAQTAQGTATGRDIVTTSLFAATRRVGYVLASATANLATGWLLNGATPFLWRGNAAGRGGFFYHARFGFNSLTAGNRHMFGAAESIWTTVDPSSGLNTCFIGKDAADTNFQIMYNDGAGTATKVDTGMVPTTDRVYDAFVYAPPFSSSIKFQLIRYDDVGAVAEMFEHEATSNLPTNTVFILPLAVSGSGTATTGAQIDLIHVYVETGF